MKATIKVDKDIDIKFLRLDVAVRYEEQDMPNDYPFRENDQWRPTIEVDTGQIVDWPKGNARDLHMKVVDEGSYYLEDENNEVLLEIEDDYVPNALLPGKYGDYIIISINEDGLITNWPRNPSIEDFIREEEY